MSENGMTGFGELFASLPDIWLAKQEIREGDWFDGDILYCGKCKKPRREIREFMGKDRLVTVGCDCEKEAAERERLAEIVKKNREVCGMDALAMSHTFDTFQITEANAKQHRLAVRYCESFSEMLAENQGLVFYGDVGTGKTYLMECIGNAVIEKGYSVHSTSFNDLLKVVSGFNSEVDEEAYIRRICGPSLLLVDDLGTERSSDFALEKVYNAVNSRSRVCKPTIYTTNLPLQMMLEPENIRYKRIYDRILETCTPIEFKGASWRKRSAGGRFNKIKQMMEE